MDMASLVLGCFLVLAFTAATHAQTPTLVEGNPYLARREWFASPVPEYHRSGFRPWNAYRWPRTSPYRNYEIHPDVKCSYLRPSGLYSAPIVVRDRNDCRENQ
ncbi:hypothetical protein Pan44_53520 [Caulifigura coniformis]|uniref:Uncharacterized protein n=1 Tax=Caulifigura coniformis TaxID=2527983 RepID=A0A517SMC0_9PLAN|nr:hypothetical protein Pan44_53520 [Caulifigura coniformis]